MKKTANSIIRKEAWASIMFKAPPMLVKNFRKAMLDADCTSRQAVVAFMHAVITGELKIVRKNTVSPKTRIPSDASGVFDDYRALIMLQDGKLLNPLPYSNKYIEKI